MYNQDLLLELFESILLNRANAIEIKTVIAEIQNKKTISKEEKEDKPMQDITNLQKNLIIITCL